MDFKQFVEDLSYSLKESELKEEKLFLESNRILVESDEEEVKENG